MKRLLSLMLALALMLSCTAVLAENEAATEVPAEAAEKAAPVVLAVLNGQEITDQNAYLKSFMEYYQNLYSMYGMDMSDPQMLAMLKAGGMEYAISTELMFQKARELGFDQFTDEEVAAFEQSARDYIEEYITNAMAQNGITAESSEEDKTNARAAVLADMQAQGYEEASYMKQSVESAKEQATYDRLYQYVTKDIKVTDEDVTKHFNDLVKEDMERAAANPAEYVAAYENFRPYLDYPEYLEYVTDTAYYIPEGYRAVTHILLTPDEPLLDTWKGLAAQLEEQNQAPENTETSTDAAAETAAEPEATEEPVTQEMVDAAAQAIMDNVQPKVDEIKQKLADGASFNDLIAEYGSDSGMSTEEARAEGYLVHANSVAWDPVFTAGAMSLEKVGDVSEPVLGSHGVHLIYYLKDVPAGAVELSAELKDYFKGKLLTEQQESAFSLAQEEWLKEAKLEYTEEGESWKKAAETAATTVSEDAEAPAGETETAETADAEAPAEAPETAETADAAEKTE